LVPEAVLLKPGRLLKEEFEAAKLHVSHGERIIELMSQGVSRKDFIRHAKLFCRFHHERWDGSGYPMGLRGEDIPLEGRIMAIADVYDALTSQRPYKNPYPHDYAVRVIQEEEGSSFDPFIVQAFRDVSWKFDGKA
jgi:putative two-component system response regulator